MNSEQSAKARVLRRLLEEGCRSCDFEEADGELYCHCAKCQLAITRLAYELIVTNRMRLAA
jgi:hypothetical protein